MMNKRITGIVERTLAYHAKALAWRAAKHDIDRLLSYARVSANIRAIDIRDASAD
jgi:hypothetical protein